MRILIFSLTFVLIIACNSDQKSYKSLSTMDAQLPFTTENFQGAWASVNDKTNAAFKIEGSNFLFNENGTFKSFPCEIKGDSFIVTYPNLRFGYKVILWKADSVHLMDEYQTNSFIRLKN